MCGIVGYVGEQAATPLLLDGLAKLEYRGYDSAGIALAGNTLCVHKAAGRLSVLENELRGLSLPQRVGIGHTRWATHGAPTDQNAHPHVSGDGAFAVVHNGIIENYTALRERLHDVSFVSQTDTEVIAHLLQHHFDGNLLSTVRRTVADLEGAFALGIVSSHAPDCLFAVRKASPLVIGICRHGVLIASDVTALLPYTRQYIPLADGDIARITRNDVTIFDKKGKMVGRPMQEVTWDVESAQKGGYDHFMLKEIYEQPEAVWATLSPRLNKGRVVLDDVIFTDAQLAALRRIHIVACGSSYHVGLVGKTVLEQLTRLPVEVDLASEFRYRDPLVDSSSLVIVISQSGETADTLAALREAKARGARVLSVVNVVGSSIAAESDDVLYTWAGPEIAVATTKAYSTQLAMMYLIAIHLGERLGRLGEEEVSALTAELKTLPDRIRTALRTAARLRELAKRYQDREHAYFIGRGLDYAVAMEGSLKLKEISYLHSEAYAAGELKHGTISLVETGTLVVAAACVEAVAGKTLSNVQEVKARGAEVLLLVPEGAATDGADHVVTLPRVHPLFIPSVEVIPLQLWGYFLALARGCDIDNPRNLAKSVTVE
ncbi:MAG: glutamine--fructose-6-phosphate transaminase (isomerizing) [Clostridia bacterium]|nr:glutamine--fructose-6-phosphate transaminase (isomerizing) [Clostridia bacterium]